MIQKNLIIFGVMFGALVAACTLTPRDTGTAFMFALAPIKIIQQQPDGESLVVAAPTTSPELDTYRIALLGDGKRWDYYAGARWSDFLPMLVQDNITKTLEYTRMFRGVTTDETGLPAERMLKTEIRDFEARYEAHDDVPVIKIRMVVSLLTRAERKPILSFTVNAEKKAAGPHLAQIQEAFTDVFNDAQRQMIEKLDQRPKLKQP